MEQDPWGTKASLEGSIQALSETVELQRIRADLAEKRLRFVRRMALEPRFHHSVPTWRILEILNGAADAE